MTTESNQAAGDERPSEPLRLSYGDQVYEVPAERIGHLHAALVAADKSCTASGRSARNQPPEGVTGSAASAPHYLAADVAGDIAHWIAQQTGFSAASAISPLPVEVPC
jgi:hypothetical protein